MKTVLSAMAVCLAIGATAAAFQGVPPPAQQQQPQQAEPQQTPPDVTLTGCLIQGSSPAVFLFDNAKKDPKSTSEKGERYLVLISGEDLNLKTHLNHEVSMTGRVALKPAPPAGQKPTEKDLPTFATKNVMLVSDTCGAAR